MNMPRKLFLFSFLSTIIFNTSAEKSVNSEIESIDEAFVTFVTPNYFSLLEILLDSVHYFSKKPIVVYGINTDLPFNSSSYPRLIKRRIDDNEHTKLPLIYFQKFNIILKSNIKHGIYVEADDIVNYGVDLLFEHCKKVQRYPLCPIHPRDPNDQSMVMHLMGVTKKTNPYLHGHIIFSQHCMPFLRECYDFCIKHGNSIGANWDETVMNVMLWKHNVSNLYVSIFDPYYESITNYINQDNIALTDFSTNAPIEYHLFHGCKNPQEARNVLDLLKINVGKNISFNTGDLTISRKKND